MKTKTFDCVEMKRQGAARIHEAVKDLTLKQKIEYWQRRSAAFRQEQELLLSKPPVDERGASAISPDGGRSESPSTAPGT